MIEFFVTFKPILIVVHAIAAAVGLGSVVVTDALFFRYLKDFKISHKEEETMKTISQVVWGAIVVLFLSGIALYLSAPLEYLAKSKFIVKVVIFAVIVTNGVVLNVWLTPALKKIAFGPVVNQPKRSLRIMRRIAFASGVVSAISWLSVFILGSVRSIPVTVSTGLLVYAIIIMVGVVGSQVYATYLKYGLPWNSEK